MMETLKQLYKTYSPSGEENGMRQFLREQIECCGAEIGEDEYGNLFVTRGNADLYPCLVAHCDEVRHNLVADVIEEDGRIFAIDNKGMRTGCGADDKNGLWIILKLLCETNLPLKAAIFAQEESGCEGSFNCDLMWFTDTCYLIGLDRGGNSDFVTIGVVLDLSPKEFWDADILQKYGYNFAVGKITDVVALISRGLMSPACNISVGYHNQHTNEEYTDLAALRNAYEMVTEILNKTK